MAINRDFPRSPVFASFKSDLYTSAELTLRNGGKVKIDLRDRLIEADFPGIGSGRDRWHHLDFRGELFAYGVQPGGRHLVRQRIFEDGSQQVSLGHKIPTDYDGFRPSTTISVGPNGECPEQCHLDDSGKTLTCGNITIDLPLPLAATATKSPISDDMATMLSDFHHHGLLSRCNSVFEPSITDESAPRRAMYYD